MRTHKFKRLALKTWPKRLAKRLPVRYGWAIALAGLICLLIIGSYQISQWLTPTATISVKTVRDVQEMPLLMRHESAILSVEFTTPLQHPLSLVSTDNDGIIKLWHVKDDPDQVNFASEVLAVSANVMVSGVHPEHPGVATINQEAGVALWDLSHPTPNSRTFTHDRKVLAASFSPDNRILATGDQNGIVHLWDLQTGKSVATLSADEHKTLNGHEDEVLALAFSPDGSRLASGGSDGLIYLWDWQAGKAVWRVETDDIVASIDFSPDGKTLATSGRPLTADGIEKIQLWNATTGKLGGELKGFAPVSFSPDGKRLAGSTQTDTGIKQVTVWALNAPSKPVTLTQGVYPFVFTPNGQAIATDSAGGKIKVWHRQHTSLVGSFQGRQKNTGFLAVRPQAQLFLAATDEKITAWTLGGAKRFSFHLKGMNRYGSFSRSLPLFHAVALSSDGQRLAVAIANRLEVMPLDYVAKMQQMVNVQLERPLFVTFNPRDHNLILVDVAKITLVRPKDGHVIRSLNVELPEEVNSFAISPDGKTLAVAGTGGLIQLWNLQTGTVVGQFQGDEQSTVLSLAFSPNGRFLASGSWGDQLRVWDVRQRQLVLSMASDRVFSVVFSPAGDLVASGSQTGEIQLWDAKTGEKLRTLVGHAGGIQSLTFSPSGEVLASSSEDKTIKLWRVSPAAG